MDAEDRMPFEAGKAEDTAVLVHNHSHYVEEGNDILWMIDSPCNQMSSYLVDIKARPQQAVNRERGNSSLASKS